MSKKAELISLAAVLLTMVVCFALSFVHGNPAPSGRLYIESRLIENSDSARLFLPVAFGLSKRQNKMVNKEINNMLQTDKLLEATICNDCKASLRFETQTLGNVINISAFSVLRMGNETLEARAELYFDIRTGKRYDIDDMFSFVSKRRGMLLLKKRAQEELSVNEVSGCFKLFSQHMSLIYPRGDQSGFVSCDIPYDDIKKYIGENNTFIKALSGA